MDTREAGKLTFAALVKKVGIAEAKRQMSERAHKRWGKKYRPHQKCKRCLRTGRWKVNKFGRCAYLKKKTKKLQKHGSKTKNKKS